MKSNVRTFLVLMVIAGLCLTWFAPVLGEAPIGPVSAKNPDVPQGVQNFNYSGMTPNQFRHNYTYGSPHLLRFRNMWMLMNCSRNMELNITADPNLAMNSFSLNVRLNYSLRLHLNADMDPPAHIQTRAQNSIGVYLTLEPNATGELDATIGLYIDEEAIEAELGKKIDPESLSWAFWNGEEWEAVESQIDSDGYLIADTDHFSTWTVLDLSKPVLWTTYIVIIAVGAAVIIALAIILLRRH